VGAPRHSGQHPAPARGLSTNSLDTLRRYGRTRAAVAVQTEKGMPERGITVPADDSSIQAGVDAVLEGEVVAVPTDTLYGLAACATNTAAVQELYRIKGRDALKPVAICVADVGVYGEMTHLSAGLLEALLPGPVTLILRRRAGSPLSDSLNPGVANIGIRIPDAGFIRALARGCGAALALTSANLSGGASTVRPEEFRPLWPQCRLVFDGGKLGTEDRRGSTVVDLSMPNTYLIVREGSAMEPTVAALEAHGLSPQVTTN